MNSQDYRLDELRAQLTYTKLMLYGTFSLARMLITNAGSVKKLRVTKENEEHYVRPPRLYDLPDHPQNTQIPSAKGKYLRPTRFCDHTTPEVIAMAEALGAFSLSKEKYVQAAFEFVKEEILLEILPIDSVEATLRRGTGTCFHLISVFIALCRAAGIPARYKMFAMNMIQAWQGVLIDADPLVKKWYDALGYFVIEGEGEVLLNHRWVVAHVGPTAERQAAAGLPITRLGEDAIGRWFFARPGTIMHFEAIPLGLSFGSHLLQKIAPGSMERINLSVMRQTEQGRQVLEAAGGVEAYDTTVRGRMGPKTPTVDLSPRPEIAFGSK